MSRVKRKARKCICPLAFRCRLQGALLGGIAHAVRQATRLKVKELRHAWSDATGMITYGINIEAKTFPAAPARHSLPSQFLGLSAYIPNIGLVSPPTSLHSSCRRASA